MHLYSGPLSLFSRKVEIALGEKGIAFSRTMVPFTQTEGYHPRHEAVLAANPKGQVPVLIDGDVKLYDSTVIVEYLEDAYPEPPFYPMEAADKARCRLAELEADEVLLEPVRKLMFRTEPPGGDHARRADQERSAMAAQAIIAEHLRRLDARLESASFLCGEYSAADIAAFLVIHWSLRLGGPELDGHRNLRRWYLEIAARPTVSPILSEIAAADRELSYPVVGCGFPA